MAEKDQWAFPRELQPHAEEYAFDLNAALNAVVALRADIPEDAFTAAILGTERTGNGVVIRDDGLILTIGYLITEAETVWLTANDGTVAQGYPLAYDFASGFGLVQPLSPLGVRPLPQGSAALAEVDDDVIVIGNGGRTHALKARINDKREFAGYWEYLLDQALFTAPAHPE
ncbi:MAG: S1C family serine protease, partial [Betaproteobacteria bacterium]